MSLLLDLQYIDKIRGYVRNFKEKPSYKFEFSCPICGDSVDNRKKARGALIRRNDEFRYKCLNCGEGRNFYNFIREVDGNLAKEYQITKMVESRQDSAPYQPQIIKKIIKPIDDLFSRNFTPIIKLKLPHIALSYIKKRRLPIKWAKKLYFTENFGDSVKEVFGVKDNISYPNDPRLVIPFRKANNQIMMIQGRSLDNECTLRYMTARYNDDDPKIFGLEEINQERKVFVFEGPFDAMFIENSLAMGGADAGGPAEREILDSLDTVFIYDNEPRNPGIINRMKRKIESMQEICVWPPYIKQKDVNDMILKENMTPEDIKQIITENTHTGLRAQMVLDSWARL